MHRGRGSRLLLRLRSGVPGPSGTEQGTDRQGRIPDQDHLGPRRTSGGQEGGGLDRGAGSGRHRQRDERDTARKDEPSAGRDGEQPDLRTRYRCRGNRPAPTFLARRRWRRLHLQDFHHGGRAGSGPGRQLHSRRARTFQRQGSGRGWRQGLSQSDLVRGELPRPAVPEHECHRGSGQVSQYRVRQAHLAGRRKPHRGHGGAPWPSVLRRAGHRPQLRARQQRKPGRLHQAAEHRVVHPRPL